MKPIFISKTALLQCCILVLRTFINCEMTTGVAKVKNIFSSIFQYNFRYSLRKKSTKVDFSENSCKKNTILHSKLDFLKSCCEVFSRAKRILESYVSSKYDKINFFYRTLDNWEIILAEKLLSPKEFEFIYRKFLGKIQAACDTNFY